ncbi:type II toxin-antitoxin system HicB family antitoxin [Testudinibacter sp. P80/BLE/0925]
MLFTIGVESPDNQDQAYGLVVPALFTHNHSCFSAADEQDDILPMVTDVIRLTLESLVESGVDISEIKDRGFKHYKTLEDFDHCDTWLLIDFDISEYLGKKQRVNISMPEYLLKRIDQQVANLSGLYKDRSHFLATAAHRELYAHAKAD